MKKVIKYRMIFIIAVLVFCVTYVKSPYDGPYYQDPSIVVHFLVTFVNFLVYLIPTNKLTFFEKIGYSFLTTCLVLIGVGILLEVILGLMFGYDPYYGDLQSPPILDNILYFFLTTFSGIGLLEIWVQYKRAIHF